MVVEDEKVSGELKIFKDENICSLGVEVSSESLDTGELNLENHIGARSIHNSPIQLKVYTLLPLPSH